MEQYHETGKVGRVEDNYDVLDIRAVFLDVLAEILRDLAVTLEQVLAGHAFLARGSSGRDNVLGTLESYLRVCGPSDVGAFESAMGHLGHDTLQTRFINVIKADVRCELEHHRRLGHVGSDHSGGADDDQFVICQKSHFRIMFMCLRFVSFITGQR